jgi:hypothetical protein
MISQEKLIEAAIMGLVSYMIGTILMKFIKKDDPKNGRPSITFADKVVLFSIGAVIHLLVKETKMDDWYCKRLALQSLARANPVNVVRATAQVAPTITN